MNESFGRSSGSRPARRPGTATATLAVTLLLATGAGHSLAAQNSDKRTQANELVRDAIVYAQRGDTAAALERLERATKLAPNLAEAHYRRGMLLSRQADNNLGSMFKRRSAGRSLKRALKIERDNPYYLLELGRLRLKQGFMRIEAGRYFKRALKAARQRGDPHVVAEIESELGDIYHRRYQALAHRRLITGNMFRFDPEEALDDEHYAKDFLEGKSAEIENAGELDLRLAEQHYRAGVASAPNHDASTAGLLNILYDQSRFEEYIEVARSFRRAAPENGRSHLFLGLGFWRVHREKEADRAFRKALALMTPAERAEITNLSVIMRKKDAERYQKFTTAQRAEYERIYWSANDPLKLSRVNEHWLEHLARVAYTELAFSSPELKMRGWQSDRGVIYIRYGPPPMVATFPPNTDNLAGRTAMSGGDDASPSVIAGDATLVGKIVTVWFYPQRNLRFVFYGPPGFNFARFAGEFRAYAEDARYASPVMYDNVPVNEALDSISVQTAAFKPHGDSAGAKAEVVFFAGLPINHMIQGVDLSNAPLESGLFVTDPLEREIIGKRRTENIDFQRSDQFETRTFRAELKPGVYRYRVEARQPATRRAARGMSRLNVESFDRSSLKLSDIVLADRIAPRTAVPAGLDDFLIDPNAAMSFEPGRTLHMYWEVYNLHADTTGTVRFKTEVLIRVQSLERHGFGATIVGGLLDAVGASAKGDDQVTMEYGTEEVLSNRDRVPAWLAVDLSDAPNGTYSMELTVTDLSTGRSTVRRRSFTITDVEAQ